MILFIEKIATDHTHSSGDEHDHSMLRASMKKHSRIGENVNADSHLLHNEDSENIEDFDDNIIREGLNKNK